MKLGAPHPCDGVANGFRRRIGNSQHYTVSRDHAFESCLGDPDLFARLVGERISPRWTKRVSAKISRGESCTHHLELLFSMATVAYQAVVIAPEVDGIDALGHLQGKDVRPYFLGGCRAWRLDGPLVAEMFPRFAEPGGE